MCHRTRRPGDSVVSVWGARARVSEYGRQLIVQMTVYGGWLLVALMKGPPLVAVVSAADFFVQTHHCTTHGSVHEEVSRP